MALPSVIALRGPPAPAIARPTSLSRYRMGQAMLAAVECHEHADCLKIDSLLRHDRLRQNRPRKRSRPERTNGGV
jgi:hypothetical protein